MDFPTNGRPIKGKQLVAELLAAGVDVGRNYGLLADGSAVQIMGFDAQATAIQAVIDAHVPNLADEQRQAGLENAYQSVLANWRANVRPKLAAGSTATLTQADLRTSLRLLFLRALREEMED